MAQGDWGVTTKVVQVPGSFILLNLLGFDVT